VRPFGSVATSARVPRTRGTRDLVFTTPPRHRAAHTGAAGSTCCLDPPSSLLYPEFAIRWRVMRSSPIPLYRRPKLPLPYRPLHRQSA
jgi:hypothetical protein